MDSLGHAEQGRLKKSQLKAIASFLNMPVKDIRKVANDLVDMDLLRITQDDELEVFDGKQWQKIKI